jgi:tetratricopeptide (TPR) repeat protein
MRRRYDQAIELGRKVSELNPSFSACLRYYLAALGHAGQRTEANRVRERLLTLEPHVSVALLAERSPFERLEDTEHLVEGLRMAGLS